MQWIALVGALIVLLALDLRLARREPASMSVRTASVQSIGWVLVALAFAAVLAAARGTGDAGLYLAGYLVEKSLSLDNVFVFLLILTSFGIADGDRHRLLTYGIGAALVLRGVFIVAGAAALHHASWVAFIFAALLIWTGWRMFRHRHDSQGETAFVATLQRRMPGSVAAAALAALVLADIVFAIDSVPSILAITDDVFVVFAANAFALLGLAPLFFLVADLVERLYHLKTALAALLVAIGIKMAAGEIWGKVGPEVSLPVIALILGAGVAASLIRDRRHARSPRSEQGSGPPGPGGLPAVHCRRRPIVAAAHDVVPAPHTRGPGRGP